MLPLNSRASHRKGNHQNVSKPKASSPSNLGSQHVRRGEPKPIQA